MKLYANPISPFARKARIVAHELGLKLEIINLDPRNDEDFRRINPLKKIPVLILDDGSALMDSPVICEYLNHVGGGKFFPGMSIWRANSGRWKALTLQALADGVMEAAVAWRYEKLEPDERRNPDHIARYRAAIVAGLDAFERVAYAEFPTIGEISIGCALGYIEFRHPELDWRADHPKLTAWYQKFCQYPSVQATVPQ